MLIVGHHKLSNLPPHMLSQAALPSPPLLIAFDRLLFTTTGSNIRLYSEGVLSTKNSGCLDVLCQSAIRILARMSEMSDISELSQGCHNCR